MGAPSKVPFPVLALYQRCERLTGDEGAEVWASYMPVTRQFRVRELKGAEDIARQVEAAHCLSDDAGDVRGRVWELSRDAAGCRKVQAALEGAETEQERELLASELRGHVLEAARCPHANYVLQRCVTTLSGEAVQFIVDELQPRALAVAKSKFGCRAIQRLIERCSANQVDKLLGCLLAEFRDLSTHAYGKFVLQHMLSHGPEGAQQRLRALVEAHAPELCAHPQGGTLVCAALGIGELLARKRVAQRLLQEPQLIGGIAAKGRGHAVLKRMLAVLDGPDHAYVQAVLERGQALLSQHRSAQAPSAQEALMPLYGGVTQAQVLVARGFGGA